MRRAEAIEMVRKYGRAIKEDRLADAAQYGVDLVEALSKGEPKPDPEPEPEEQ